ncbi:MAG TPA: DUF938 domain-containing protein [Xenococcaceae cyanobacterium]
MDARKFAPATQRNREPILEVLFRVLPTPGNILEIASGTGEHSIFFAPRLAPRQWYPSESNPQLRDSITAWQNSFPSDNLHPPLAIDAATNYWSIETQNIPINAIVNINMIHISPWETCLGLMAGANRILPVGGILYLYGPYKRNGEHTAPSNQAFDLSLRSQNPEWGVRNLEDVITVAQENNLILQKIVPMPANNLSVVWQRIAK